MDIYEQMHLPSVAKIDRVVPKKQFYDNADLTSSDKKLFDRVEKIRWRYALKTENTNIPAYMDAEKEYLEIEIIEVILREEKNLSRLAEIIFRAIPYPMLLFFRAEEKTSLWLGKLRVSESDKSRMTLTETEHTDFLPEDAPLWEKLSLKAQSTANFAILYESWYDTVSRSRLAELAVDVEDMTGEAARERLSKLQEAEREIKALRSQMKKESQFNRKMELNTRLQRLKATVKELRGE